jgi:hypothetical protein
MSITIHYGADATCELPLDDATRLAPDAAGRPSLSDPAAATRAALAAPRDYPPLAAALAPGDRVTIALGRGVPELAAVLRGVIEELSAAGVAENAITVLSAEPLVGKNDLAGKLQAAGVTVALHDPDDEKSIAMLGMNSARHAVRLNRLLTDADFVLPIAAAKSAGGARGAEKFAALFPRFSNRETADRLNGRGKSAGPTTKSQRKAEVNEAGWLLGVGLEVVVVPGPGGGAAAVIAGDPGAAARAAADEFQLIWERPVAERGDLVIGAMPGDASQQTWGNLARAVSACRRVVAREGAIAVCCELAERPAGSFEALVDAADFGDVAAGLKRSAAADARPALVLAQALERGAVYLRSELPDDVVESLGMTPIASDAELARLTSGRRHCIVIDEAQRVKPRYLGDADELE